MRTTTKVLHVLAGLWIAASASTTPARAQLQPGPNISPNGFMFTFSPRAGYLGPPAAIFPYAPRRVPRAYVQAPPPSPPAAPPMRYSEPGVQARPDLKSSPPAARRGRPPVPCPDGCPREPDEP